MNKIGLAALFCTVIFAIGVFAQTAQPGQMGAPQRPQMPTQGAPGTPPDQSAPPPTQSAPQPSQGRGSNIDDQVKVLSDQLNLNADQQSKIKTILTDQHNQAMELIQDNSMARDAKVEKIHSLRASTIAKVRQLLTSDQQSKFDQMVQQQDDHLRQQHSGDSSSTPSGNTSPGANSPAGSNPPTGSKPPQ